MKINVKYFNGATHLESIEKGDWIDLRANKTHVFEEGEFYMMPLGVAMELPTGYEAIVAARSSLFKRHGLLVANSIGVIDNSYCGDNDEWHLPVLATRETTVDKDERICQFRIFKNQPAIEFSNVKSLDNPDRGGFGSTGRE